MAPKTVALDKRLSIEAKGIYFLLASFVGSKDKEAYPSRDFMCDHLGISANRFRKHMDQLLMLGYVVKTRSRQPGGAWDNNRYRLPRDPARFATDEEDWEAAKVAKRVQRAVGVLQNPQLQNEAVVVEAVKKITSNSNNPNSISSSSNSIQEDYSGTVVPLIAFEEYWEGTQRDPIHYEIFTEYEDAYREKIGKEHPKQSIFSWQRIYKNLDELKDDHCLGLEEFRMMIGRHFRRNYTKPIDYKMSHFANPQILKYLLHEIEDQRRGTFDLVDSEVPF